MTEKNSLLNDAVEFEKEGISLYLELQKKAQDPVSQKLFESLVQQEKDHIKVIQEYAQENRFEPDEYTPLETTIKDVYQRLADQVEVNGGDLSQKEGLEAALELESKGFQMYKEAYENASWQNDRDFFEFLMEMEKEHYESLANLYCYLYDNNAWLAKNGSKTWEWMKQNFLIT